MDRDLEDSIKRFYADCPLQYLLNYMADYERALANFSSDEHNPRPRNAKKLLQMIKAEISKRNKL